MKVLARKEACAGHARCAAVGPDFYRLDDDGYISFTEKDVPQALETQAPAGRPRVSQKESFPFPSRAAVSGPVAEGMAIALGEFLRRIPTFRLKGKPEPAHASLIATQNVSVAWDAP